MSSRNRKVAAGAQLGKPQVERASLGIQTAVRVAIARGGAIAAAFVPTGAGQAFGIGRHAQLKDVLSDHAQLIRIAALRRELFDHSLSPVIGINSSVGVKCGNSTMPMSPAAT